MKTLRNIIYFSIFMQPIAVMALEVNVTDFKASSAINIQNDSASDLNVLLSNGVSLNFSVNTGKVIPCHEIEGLSAFITNISSPNPARVDLLCQNSYSVKE